NHHVVEDAKEISVALGDRRYRVAELVGADPSSDLALLKIDAKDLPTVEIGSSEDLQVGEWVMAIGSPFGFELSVTAGIVSAKGRSLLDEVGYYVPYIQTDVAINPGNSGGPLLNLEGKVVGINSQIYTRSGGFMGLSFAIPIDVAMEVVEQLKDKGEVSRGWLGVLIQRVDRDLAESFGLDRAQGALITEVLLDSPAEQSGLREGDIILEFDGRKIDLSSDLPHVVGRIRADTVVDAEIVRDGKMQTIEVKVGLLPAPQERLPGERERRTYGRLGIGVEDLSPETIESLGVDKGVLVTILGQGPARKAGIEQGDVITTLDGESITSVAQLQRMVQQLPAGEAIPIRVVRNQTPEFLVIKIPE
ncbi:MAG: trypsin-like peptidase domain-containing protein, partial [bacterium]